MEAARNLKENTIDPHEVQQNDNSFTSFILSSLNVDESSTNLQTQGMSDSQNLKEGNQTTKGGRMKDGEERLANDTGSQSECRNILRDTGNPSVIDLSNRSVEIFGRLGIKAAALIRQCGQGYLSKDILQPFASSGISLCLFSSMSSMVASVMKVPDKSLCFRKRHWTVILLGTPPWAAQVINSAKNQGLYDERVHWVVLVTKMMSVSPTLSSFDITRRITWMRWDEQRNEWVVLVSKATNKGLVAREAGHWVEDPSDPSGSSKTLKTSQPLSPDLVMNFFKKTVRVISQKDTDKKPTFSTSGRCYYKEDCTTVCLGYVGVMLTNAFQSLNLSISNRRVKSCGAAGVNGTRVTVIQKNEADIALGTCSMTAGRIQVVDFTEFFYVVRATIASAEPKVLISPFLIFSVFLWQTWLAIFLYIIIVGVSLWIVGNILSMASIMPKRSFSACLVVFLKALIYQGHNGQPTSFSGRAVVAASWVVTITLVGVYSGNLTAWLSILRYERPINNLADLAERSDLPLHVHSHDPNHQMFENQTEGLLGIVRKRLALGYGRHDGRFAFTRAIVEGKIHYMNSERSIIRRAAQLNRLDGFSSFSPCRLHLSTQDVRQDYLGLIVNKNSWLSEQVNTQIRWLRSYGIINSLYKKYNPPGCRLTTAKDRRMMSKRRSLGIHQLQGVFWVWVVGMVMASGVFLVERATVSGFSSMNSGGNPGGAGGEM